MTINNEHKKLNVPNLRFKEFEGEWEKKTIGEISTIKNGPFGSVLHAEDYVDEGMPIVTTEHFKNGNLPQSKNGIPQVSDDDYYRLRGYKLEKDDIVFSRVGSIDINAHVEQSQQGWLFSGRVLRVRPIKSVNSLCLHYILSTESVKRSIRNRAVGQTMPSINTPILSNTKINIPQSVVEQKKIANLLALLDKRIAIQNKIIDKLQSLIKGISKQLLMNNQNWRTVRIGELLRIGNGKDYKHLGIGKIPVYGTGGQMLLVNDYLYDGESVCIGRKGTIDKPMFLKGKFWTVDTLFYTYDFKDVLPKFCYYLFLQINWKLYNEGTGVPSLSKSTIENIKVKIPSIEQQHNICSVLDCYEHKTKSEEQILELYLSEKQYLLRQMFI
mgnify:FL=1